MPCWHLKPDIMSTSWEWMAYPAFPASMHFYVLFLQTCQNEFGLSWPVIFWWLVFCSRNLRWLRDLFTNFEQFLAQTSFHIPSTSVHACGFPSLRPPNPLVLVLVERVPWVPVLPHGLLLIYLIVVSIRFETSSKSGPALFRCPSIWFSNR